MKHENAPAIPDSHIGFFYLSSNESYGDLTFLRPVVVRGARGHRIVQSIGPLPDASAYAAELIGAVRVLQAITNERLAISRFGGGGRARLRGRAQIRSARAVLTAIAIFLVSASVMVVLWVDAQEVLSEKIPPGRLGQFVLYVSRMDLIVVAGAGGFEPPHGGIKIRCLTAWLRPKRTGRSSAA